MNAIDLIEKTIEKAVLSNRHILLAFDFDGTLAPLAPTPGLTFLPTATREHLFRLTKTSNMTVAIISGRSIDQLKDYFNIDNIWIAGSGGLVIKAGNRIHEYPAINYINSILMEVALRLTALCNNYQGAWLEIKPGTLSVHFRDLSIARQAGLIKSVAYMIAVEEKLESLVATQAIEIRPRCGWHKGTAIEIMRQELWNDSNISPYIAYFGDSANDREAVDAANRFGGISVGVGKESPTNCLFYLSTPIDVERVLHRINQCVTSITRVTDARELCG